MSSIWGWLKYIGMGVAGALVLAGISGSWLLALQSGERARLERDAPAVLGTSVALNASAQELLDGLTEKISSDPENADRDLSRELADHTRTLESLLAVVDQSKEGGLREAHDEIKASLRDNISYLNAVQTLLASPILEMGENPGSQLESQASTTRLGFASVFRTIRVNPNPYADNEANLLNVGPLSEALVELRDTVLGWKERYEGKLDAITSVESRMSDFASSYNAMRASFGTSSIETGLQHEAPYFEYESAREILSTARAERAGLLSQVSFFAPTAPKGLQEIAYSLQGILSRAVDAIVAAEDAVTEFEDDQDYYWCCSLEPFWYSVTETPSWSTFEQLSAPITASFQQWEEDLKAAVNRARNKLQNEFDRLAAFQVDVPPPR